MTRLFRRIGVCGWLALSLLAMGCASTASSGKNTPTHVPSLASTLGSVHAAGKPEPAQPKLPNPVEGSRLFRQALQQLEQRNNARAIELFEQSAEADPTQAATQNNLGILYKQTGQLDKAIAAYQQAVARQAAYPDAYYNLALAYRASGQFKEAEGAYLKALAQNEQFADAHYNLGILYELYLGQPAKALEQYQAYLRLNGAHAKDVTTWAASLERLVPKPAAPAPAQPSGQPSQNQAAPASPTPPAGPSAPQGAPAP
ncbi:MAG: tetratricopeptide repeat protein [Nitrospirae bacterium]|nr:tetratricopeptide repeat protein [Nitrospirota bacterium]